MPIPRELLKGILDKKNDLTYPRGTLNRKNGDRLDAEMGFGRLHYPRDRLESKKSLVCPSGNLQPAPGTGRRKMRGMLSRKPENRGNLNLGPWKLSKNARDKVHIFVQRCTLVFGLKFRLPLFSSLELNLPLLRGFHSRGKVDVFSGVD